MKVKKVLFCTLIFVVFSVLSAQAGSKKVYVKLINNTNTDIKSGHTLKYFDGSWKTASISYWGVYKIYTKKDSLNFIMTYNNGIQETGMLSIINKGYVVFKTAKVVPDNKKGCIDFSNDSIYYSQGALNGSWDFSSGNDLQLLPGEYNFSLTHGGNGLSYEKTEIVAPSQIHGIGCNKNDKPSVQSSNAHKVCIGSSHIISTDILTTITLQDSDGNLLSGGVANYFDSVWSADIPSNSQINLETGLYDFKMVYNNGTELKSKINICHSKNEVVFTTVTVTAALETCDGDTISGGQFQYWQNDTSVLLHANSEIELLSGFYGFRMYYNHGAEDKGNVEILASNNHQKVLFEAKQIAFADSFGIIEYTQNGTGIYKPGMYLLSGHYIFKIKSAKMDVFINTCDDCNCGEGKVEDKSDAGL